MMERVLQDFAGGLRILMLVGGVAHALFEVVDTRLNRGTVRVPRHLFGRDLVAHISNAATEVMQRLVQDLKITNVLIVFLHRIADRLLEVSETLRNCGVLGQPRVQILDFFVGGVNLRLGVDVGVLQYLVRGLYLLVFVRRIPDALLDKVNALLDSRGVAVPRFFLAQKLAVEFTETVAYLVEFVLQPFCLLHLLFVLLGGISHCLLEVAHALRDGGVLGETALQILESFDGGFHLAPCMIVDVVQYLVCGLLLFVPVGRIPEGLLEVVDALLDGGLVAVPGFLLRRDMTIHGADAAVDVKHVLGHPVHLLCMLLMLLGGIPDEFLQKHHALLQGDVDVLPPVSFLLEGAVQLCEASERIVQVRLRGRQVLLVHLELF
mmetsp:Transcript_79587/g.221435  ORF Transcript_79587/g.221435 Transcript_79587/m.221435 type:complete len:378 (+) Transcript_79587:425-1558(+)